MKKFLATLLVLFAASTSVVYAQQKGDIYVGGNLQFGLSSAIVEGASATATEFMIQPNMGVFVADKFMVGFDLGYSALVGDSTTHTLVVGPKFSYFIPLCDKLYYTPTLDIAFCYAVSDGFGLPGFGLGANFVCFEYQPTEHIGLSASMLSLNYIMFSRAGITVNEVDFGLSLSPSIGFKYYF